MEFEAFAEAALEAAQAGELTEIDPELLNDYNEIFKSDLGDIAEAELEDETVGEAMESASSLEDEYNEIFKSDIEDEIIDEASEPDDLHEAEAEAETDDAAVDRLTEEAPQEFIDEFNESYDGALKDELEDEQTDRDVEKLSDKSVTQKIADAVKEILDPDIYNSTYKDRIDRTPDESGKKGHWTGERGESVFIPNNPAVKLLLKSFGLEGIPYKNGIPDFSKVSACTVKIDNMSELRDQSKTDNFGQCDAKCAEAWNKEAKDGKTDWTADDVAKWREQNGYTWHERNDMKTCDLVPSSINSYFSHLGGVSEAKSRDAVYTGSKLYD
ncbi:MAG: HNH endonuclease [Oscillospiraceae bacterium]|nr:HNH endonuclease [Oscillospiraceae bacterium]